MLAGGMVVAAPSMVPTAAAAGALYVSAENAQFDNLFGGPMVIEVIVKDSNRSMTNENAGEPTVMVDNTQLRLAQGLDGNWYGYFADSTDVSLLANVSTDQLDWGTTGAVLSYEAGTGTTAITNYTVVYQSSTPITTNNFGGVLDNPPKLSNWRSLNGTSCDACGQIGVNPVQWPFLQVFDFTQGDFDVILEQAGTNEVITLDHNNADLDDYASITLDRNSATQGSEIYMFIVDQQLNIDPTDEDKVIFKVPTNGTTTGAGIAWTNGTFNWSLIEAGDTTANAVNASGYVAAGAGHGFGDNGKLLINFDTTSSGTTVLAKDLTLDDLVVEVTKGSDIGYKYFVFVEDADNTGTFSNVDDDDDANLGVTSTAKRGTTATFDYNDSAQSFIVANDFGTIDMDESSVGTEWNSGEELTVTLRDQDLNKNTGSDEDLTMALSDLIPSIQIGSPIMIDSPATGTSTVDGVVNATKLAFSNIRTVDTYSGLITGGSSVDTNLGINMGQLVSTLTTAHANSTTGVVYTFINYDVTSLMSTVTGIAIQDSANAAASITTIGDLTSTRGLEQVHGALTGMTSTNDFLINFTGTGVSIATDDRFYVDVFTFGDGTATSDRTNNAIYRMELEETGDNTGEFAGSVEYIMLNQLNVDTAATFSGITPTSDEVIMIVHEDLTDEDSPRVNYNDLGADGVTTQVADQVAAPSHSGVVSFDSANYKTADTVIVTLEDQDLNVDSDLIDVYITKSDDKVGNGGSDHVLDITFDDTLWDGLEATDFTLVETDADSGIFVGSFQIPTGQTGKDIEVNYNDHRDASGKTIEVGAGAS